MSRSEMRPFKRVRRAFNQADLKRVCEMHETEFAERYQMETVVDDIKGKFDDYADFHLFRDNGSNILAVAHLDTVVAHRDRTTSFHHVEKVGPVVLSGALDDRLGAYTILELLPALGINVDVLLTTGEESGRSTAKFFQPTKEYNWVIEFDRGGTDVVLYQYHDAELEDLVSATGAKVSHGAYSDISYMDHLEVKAMNWGVGYRDYHSVRGHALLNDYWMMVSLWLKFHAANVDTYLPHEDNGRGMGRNSWSSYRSTYDYVERECITCTEMFAAFYSDQEECDDCEFGWFHDAAPCHSARSSAEVFEEELPFEDVPLEDIISEDPVVVGKALARMDMAGPGMPGRSLN